MQALKLWHSSIFTDMAVCLNYNAKWKQTGYIAVCKVRQLPRCLSGKETACQCIRCGFHSWVGKIPSRRKWQFMPVFLPGKSHRQRSLEGYSSWGHKRVKHWRRKWQPTPVFLPGKSHGRKRLVGYSAWGRRESDTTEQLHFHFQDLEPSPTPRPPAPS